MKRKKPTLAAGKRGFTNGVGGTNGKKVAPAKSMRRPVFRQPKTELEQAIQRYIDLFDFAPIGYVTFDRVGRIEEINFAAIRLLRRSRRQLIGTTFAICVAKEDTQLFLNHLRECRSSDNPVMTELNLTRAEGRKIPVLLSSTATLSLMKDGARLYQTAIFDLTERKAADAALREKEAELELIVTQTPFMLTRCSRDLRYRYVSRAYARMLGRTPEEIAGKPILEIMGKEGLKTISPHIERVLKGQTVEYETEVSFQGVGAPCLYCVYAPDRDAKGNVIGWFASIVDVTEQKRAGQALRESQQRLQATYERAPIGIIESSPEGKYVGANEEFCRILGYSKDELLLRGIKDVTHEEDYPRDSRLHRQLLAGEIPFYETEKRYVRKDGMIVWAEMLRSVVRDADGKPLYTVGAVIDITRRKGAEEKLSWLAAFPQDNPNPILEFDLETKAIYYANPAADESFPDLQHLGLRHPFLVRVLEAANPLLRERTKPVHAEINIGKNCYAVTAVCIPKTKRLRVYSIDITQRKRAEDRFRLAVESAPSGMIMVDKMGKITLVNSQTERLFGYTRDELIGKSVELLVPQRFRHRHADYRAGFSAAPQARVMGSGRDLYGLRKDGSEVPIEIGLNPIEVGGQTLILSSIVDITARKKAEGALQKSKELLEQRVRERTHELHAANKELKNEIERRKGMEEEILTISDREQQRLGQELHDGLCQHLTAVAFMTRSMALRLKNHRVIDVSDIEKIAQLVNDAATDTRNLSRALHRIDIDAAGFVTALEDLVDREIWKIPCRLEIKPSFHIDDDAVAAQLYRIAREAVINANKHAEAREIVVKLERSSRGMVLHVIDDGVGFSNGPTLKPGLGLHIMDYRSRMFGGRLVIASPKHGGTSISCYLPNHAPEPQKKGNDRPRHLSAKLTKALTALI